MIQNIVCYIVYDIVYDIIRTVIPKRPANQQERFLMTGYPTMFKFPLQSCFLDCTAQFVSLHVPLGHVPNDP